MGLDSYLYGIQHDHKAGEDCPENADGIPTCPLRKFAYWRKEWGLHEYIVKNFWKGQGEYEYHPVPLDASDIARIMQALADGSVKVQSSASAFVPALAWLEQETADAPRTVAYSGNW